ncbi:MAG: hypothetical protein M1830_010531 [Pleopsidium flavum]|nr:MAG: hypothetical protein M1830_010531 [Pleopsidium flavum]
MNPLDPTRLIKVYEPLLPCGLDSIFDTGETEAYDWESPEIEYQVFRALGNHERVVEYLGKGERGLVLRAAKNGNVHPFSLLLDAQLNVKLCNFGASIYKDLNGQGWEACWDPEKTKLNVITELFALGSVMYEVMTGHAPYPVLADQEIED